MSVADPNTPLEELIPPPDHIIDDNKVYSVAAACIALGAVSGLFVCMRLGTRMWYRSFGADDWAAMAALVSLQISGKQLSMSDLVLIDDVVILHWMDSVCWLCKSQWRGGQAVMGEHHRGVVYLLGGKSPLTRSHRKRDGSRVANKGTPIVGSFG